MDSHTDALNLADVDIVKETQCFPEEANRSQLPCTPEARLAYGSSQSGGCVDAQFVRHPGVRVNQMNISQDTGCLPTSQIPYVQHSAWPSYGQILGSGMFPFQQMIRNGFYPPFTPGNYMGMSPTYGVPSVGGESDRLNHSLAGHMVGLDSNVACSHMRNLNHPMQEIPQRHSVVPEMERFQEPQTLFRTKASSSGGLCHPPTTMYHKQTDANSERDKDAMKEPPAIVENNGNKNPMSTVPEASELRRSGAQNSAATNDEPMASDSVDTNRNVSRGPFSASTPLSNTLIGMQRTMNDSSKSSTPNSINHRKAHRGEEKSYLHEVKLTIAEGRVPQVKVMQDENGNIIRYKSQFMNALKLAAHAIVQGAYIDVNEHETMKEIMDEVLRQFIVPLPLPTGMVETYLKGYFKRRRSEYHQFWLKHGVRKKPDDCKKAAWVELVEYWKSPEGSKECKQNKMNAEGRRSNSQEQKQKFEVKSILEDEFPGNGLTGSPAYREGVSASMCRTDSLGFSKCTPSNNETFGTEATRNPMEDISNRLHDAVDNIMSSVASKHGSLPLPSMKSWDREATVEANASQNSKVAKTVTRTIEKVLSSLKRPQEGPTLNHGSRKSSTHPPGQSTFMGSLNDSTSCRGRVLFTDDIQEDRVTSQTKCSSQKKVTIAKIEAVLLSSDESSDEEELYEVQKGRSTRSEYVVTKCSREYTEEIEGWPRISAVGRKVASQSVKGSVMKNDKMTVNHQPQLLSKAKQKTVHEDKETIELEKRQECLKGNSSKNPGKCHRKSKAHGNSDVETRSDEEVEEEDYGKEDFHGETDDEEPAVLPREIVKRKLDDEYAGSSSKKEVKRRSKKMTSTTSQNKNKLNQMDVAVIKRLLFYKRPKNSNPIKNRVKVWVLHPEYVGKVVAEGFAGVNKRSRCVGAANEACKEGHQMISIVRVLYRNTPVMYDAQCRFPKNVHYLDQVAGLPNAPVLWCVSHLIEIPPIDQVTRLLGEVITPQSQDDANSDSDFEDSRKKRDPKYTVVAGKDNRRSCSASNVLRSCSASKGSKTGRKS